MGRTRTASRCRGARAKNAEVPFNWTVHEVDGAEIVSQNCLQCHAGILMVS
jgi:hypothetical protein